MAKPIITIIGLGLTGTGMGLGLQREAGDFEIVGHDKLPEAAQAARKAGAVHRTEWNLYRACEGAEMLVIAVPLSELAELFKLLAEDLKPGTLVFAITGLLQPAVALADQWLPAGVHFVAGHPVLTGVGGMLQPRADLYAEAVFALAPGLRTEADAVRLASDFVERVGAKPLFVDAQEHDGILAGVEQVPRLLAAALMRVSADGAGWREARRLAGQAFANSTDMGDNATAIFATLLANRENVALKLQQMRQELAEWQALLTADAPEEGKHPLLTALEEAVAERSQWEGQALIKSWDEAPASATAAAESSGFLRQMFLGNLMGKRTDKRP
jgi:prephenate dehydrogenase